MAIYKFVCHLTIIEFNKCYYVQMIYDHIALKICCMISIDYLVFVHGKMGQNTECLSIFAHVTRANALIYRTADYKGPHPITLTISGHYVKIDTNIKTMIKVRLSQLLNPRVVCNKNQIINRQWAPAVNLSLSCSPTGESRQSSGAVGVLR